jgi:hypothetical protein
MMLPSSQNVGAPVEERAMAAVLWRMDGIIGLIEFRINSVKMISLFEYR